MSELFNLEGKAAIVTGSSRGIGKAIAHRLAEHGANVVISSRKAEACEAAVREINEAVGRTAAISIPANIGEKAQIQNLADQTNSILGKIDIVICNAASNPHIGPMSEISDDQFSKILQNNILSNHWLIQTAAPQMKSRRDGVCIIVSSVGGLRGTVGLGAYAISKAADMQLARNLALELGPFNIRVNTIAPGLVMTDFARPLWETTEAREAYEARTPLRRLGKPDDIAGMAVLLSAKAGSWATGQTFVVDGGSTA